MLKIFRWLSDVIYRYKEAVEKDRKANKKTIDDKLNKYIKNNPPTGMITMKDYQKKQGGEKKVTKKEYNIKTTVAEVSKSEIMLEFGRTQGSLWISGTGLAARKLKLKKGDKVSVTIKNQGK